MVGGENLDNFNILVKLFLKVYVYFVMWRVCIIIGNGFFYGDDLVVWNKWNIMLLENEGD